jgi:hypothetical protein
VLDCGLCWHVGKYTKPTIFKKIFLWHFVSSKTTNNNTFWAMNNNIAVDKFLKTLHPGGIRTQDLLILRRTRWPLCCAASPLIPTLPLIYLYKYNCFTFISILPVQLLLLKKLLIRRVGKSTTVDFLGILWRLSISILGTSIKNKEVAFLYISRRFQLGGK